MGGAGGERGCTGLAGSASPAHPHPHPHLTHGAATIDARTAPNLRAPHSRHSQTTCPPQISLSSPAGKYDDTAVSSHACEWCPVGEFQADSGMTSCDACDEGHLSYADRRGCGDCSVRPGGGRFPNATHRRPAPCPHRAAPTRDTSLTQHRRHSPRLGDRLATPTQAGTYADNDVSCEDCDGASGRRRARGGTSPPGMMTHHCPPLAPPPRLTSGQIRADGTGGRLSHVPGGLLHRRRRSGDHVLGLRCGKIRCRALSELFHLRGGEWGWGHEAAVSPATL